MALNNLTEDQYSAQRDAELSKYEEDWSVSRYPHYFATSTSVKEFRDLYDTEDLAPGTTTDIKESLICRITAKRGNGKKLCFYTVIGNGVKLQILANIALYENRDHFRPINKVLHLGDLVGVNGFVSRSKRGELSITPYRLTLLAPCMRYYPREEFGIADPVTRVQKRYLDLLVNPKSRERFITRARVISSCRNFLEARGFLDTTTAVLSGQAGGATARPFITHHNELGEDLYLRIAPELFLKKAVVGGLDRVYEIGPQFRNEGMDPTHNPEFWTLEFYQVGADYNSLMMMNEELLSHVIKTVGNGVVRPYKLVDGTDVEINFSTPFARVEMIPTLEKTVGKFPTLEATSELRDFLLDACKDQGIICPEPHTCARLVDRLVGELIEPNCINPTFIIGHPKFMSPLAKPDRENPLLSERFELFAAGREIANAYTELNDPRIQKANFSAQAKAKELGDVEAQDPDEDFVVALEYGLPPTGGFGMGIERLTMLLTEAYTIADVIMFPTRKFNSKKAAVADGDDATSDVKPVTKTGGSKEVVTTVS